MCLKCLCVWSSDTFCLFQNQAKILDFSGILDLFVSCSTKDFSFERLIF